MAIGAYGIMNRLLVLYVMIVLGLTMGMQPIVGYNFGAQKYDRVKATLRLSSLRRVHHQYGHLSSATVSACRIGCLYQ